MLFGLGIRKSIAGLIVVLLAVAFRGASADSAPKALQTQWSLDRSEMRTQVLNLLDFREHWRTDFETNDNSILLKAFQSYRPEAPFTEIGFSIADSPYVGAVIPLQWENLYKTQYQENYSKELPKALSSVSLLQIYDEFLDMALSHALPADLQSSADQLGGCFLNRAKAGTEGVHGACELDLSEETYHINKATMLVMKLDCNHAWVYTPCDFRKRLYNFIKKDLIAYRKSDEFKKKVTGIFDTKFPVEFKKSFLAEINAKTQSVPFLVTQKFGGEKESSLWSGASLIDGQSSLEPWQWQKVQDLGSRERMIARCGQTGEKCSLLSLSDFSQGLKADLQLAAKWSQEDQADSKARAAALFYAAANRLLVLTGIDGAKFRSQAASAGGVGADFGWQVSAQAAGGIGPEPVVPELASFSFGGWAESLSLLPSRMGFLDFWDFTKLGSQEVPASEFKIFPDLMLLDENLRAVGMDSPTGESRFERQELSSLLDLLGAVIEFLKQTHPDSGVLAKFLGSAEQIEDILDVTKPVIFPVKGRDLAVGVFAQVLMNVIHSELGYLQEIDSGIRLYASVNRFGRFGEPPAQLVGRLLVMIGQLKEFLTADTTLPPAFREKIPMLDTAVFAIGNLLGSGYQQVDGSFRDETELRSLKTQISALRGMQKMYTSTHMLIHRIRIREAWVSLHRYWGVDGLPVAFERSFLSPLPKSVFWEFLMLWQETQAVVRPDLDGASNPEGLDFSLWEKRVKQLAQALERVE